MKKWAVLATLSLELQWQYLKSIFFSQPHTWTSGFVQPPGPKYSCTAHFQLHLKNKQTNIPPNMSAQDIARNTFIIIKDTHGCSLLFKFFFFSSSRTTREGSARCANVLCQEAVRYWLQGCMTLMGFDRSPRGPELSQAGACFRLQGPWVTLLKVCIPPCAWMPPNTSFKAASAERTAGLRNLPPIL